MYNRCGKELSFYTRCEQSSEPREIACVAHAELCDDKND